MTTTTLPPLTFPSEAVAADYFRTHGDEIGRPYTIVGYGALPEKAAVWPPRSALGYSAAGAWVWEDESEGRWP